MENNMNADKITTILGGCMAAGTAALPLLNAVQGTMHQSDYVSLVTAVLMAVFGWFTNKQPKVGV